MSASGFLESTYLIRILGSKLILSNNQSSATLCAFDSNFLDRFVVLQDLKQLIITQSCLFQTEIFRLVRQLLRSAIGMYFTMCLLSNKFPCASGTVWRKV